MDWFKKFYFTDGSEYKVSRVLFTILCIMALGFAALIMNYDGWSGKTHYYQECTETAGCPNFFYNNPNYCGKDIPLDDRLCTTSALTRGMVIGDKPPAIFNYSISIIIGIFIIGLLLNHLFFNMSFNFKDITNGNKGLIKKEKKVNIPINITILLFAILGVLLFQDGIFRVLSVFFTAYVAYVLIEYAIKKRIKKGPGSDVPIGGSNERDQDTITK